MEQNKVQNEKEIELDKNSNREIQLDFVYPQIFDTNRQLNVENIPSNEKDNNEDIIVVEEEGIDDQIDKNKEREHNIYKNDNIDEHNIKNATSNKQLSNLNLQQNNYPRSPDNPPQQKNNSRNKFLFFEDIYKDILFFFINPIAGSHHGQLLIDMGVKKVEFLDNMKSSAYSAYIFNILDQDNYQQGIALLKDYQERVPRSLPKVIIGGGDGTILKVIEKLLNERVNMQNCIFGLLPLGNNNTLSSALGWGDSLSVNADMSKFKVIVKDLVEASSTFVDIWKLSLKVANDGEIIQIKHIENKSEKMTKIEEKDKVKMTSMKQSFINYFSVGLDARIGFGFEKSRTETRCCNKCIYFWETCKKSCCRKTMKVNSFIESFSIVKIDEMNHNFSMMTDIENRAQKTEIFGSKKNNENPITDRDAISYKKYENVVLKGDPVTLICQNINYYIGNKEDMWKKTSNLGIELQSRGPLSKEELKEKEEIEKKEFKEVLEGEQSINDGKLEFVTFQSGVSYDIEGTISGLAEKVYHGRGPVLINFKQTPSKSETDKENRVYLNIDGDYYHIVKPQELRIRPNKSFPQSKLKFLCKKKE